MGLAFALALSACSGSSPRELTSADVHEIAVAADCEQLQEMEGEPSFYGPAIGFNCFGPESGDAVYLRFYDDPDAVTKVVDDWREAIDERNQFAYSDHWLAVGPPDRLSELLRPFEKLGPTPSAPSSRPMTSEESNLTLCSSLTYEVLLAGSRGASEEDLAPYDASYPGLAQLRDEALTASTLEDLHEDAGDDDLAAIVYLTRFDDEIKAFCARAG